MATTYLHIFADRDNEWPEQRSA
uniref:Uncharacterized protein n=1 Tax=Arundo donax TaxID=35708 RepID=A0A0A8YX11_ARUDO